MADRATVVGVFKDTQDAQRAVHELRRLGFRDDQIGVVSRHEGTGDVTKEDEGTHAAEGGLAGLATGAGVGALWGLGILAGLVPAIGPAIAGGILGTVLSSAAAGAAAAGIAGALIGLGIPEEEAEYYEGEFKAGRTIVTVKGNGRTDEAVAVFRRFNGYARDWEGTAAASASRTDTMTHATTQSHTAAPTHTTSGRTAETSYSGAARGKEIELHEEQLEVHKRPVQTGEVTVRKVVETEHKTVDVPVRKEEVVIERHPASGPASTADIHPGEELRVPVMEEQVHVEKQPVVKERVSVGKREVTDTEHVSDTVRKEHIKVEKEGNIDVNDKTKKR